MTNFKNPTYPVHSDAEYDPEIRMLQNGDAASATETFNPVLGKMVSNTHAVKCMCEINEAAIAQRGAQTIPVLLAAEGWEQVGDYYEKTVEAAGVRAAGHTQWVGPDTANAEMCEEYGYCGITPLEPTTDDYMPFRADGAPGMDVKVNIIQFIDAGVV